MTTIAIVESGWAAVPGRLPERAHRAWRCSRTPSCTSQVTRIRRGEDANAAGSAVPQRRHADDAVRVPVRRPLVQPVRLRPLPHPDKVEGGHAGHDAGRSTTPTSASRQVVGAPASGSAAGARPARCWPSRSGTASSGPYYKDISAGAQAAGHHPDPAPGLRLDARPAAPARSYRRRPASCPWTA